MIVMEQHPSLPLVAVSGIDNTVKVSYPSEQLSTSFQELTMLDIWSTILTLIFQSLDVQNERRGSNHK